MNRLSGFLLTGAFATMTFAADLLPTADAARAAISALPTVMAAAARVDSSRARAESLQHGPYEFQLSAGPGMRHERMGRTYDEWQAGVSRTWRLPRKAKLDAAIGAGDIATAEFAMEDARHAGARDLATTWFAWLRGSTAVALTNTQLETMEALRRVTARRVALGDAARLDLERADAVVAQLESTREARVLAREEARIALAEQFPRIPVPNTAPEIPTPDALPDDEVTLAQTIVTRSHEIALARALASQHRLAAARSDANRTPDPTLGLQLADEMDHDEQTVSLVFSIPLAGRGRDANARADAAAASAAEAEAAGVQRSVETAARQLARTVSRRHRAWRAAAHALAATRAAAGRVERAWQLGEIGFGELSLTRRELQEAEHTELTARLAAHEALVRLEIDRHQLWAFHLDAVPDAADPSSGDEHAHP